MKPWPWPTAISVSLDRMAEHHRRSIAQQFRWLRHRLGLR